ncbi:N-acetylmuramic acid 6-phosphate etherase [Verrucomicrobium sp. 3C]|uniref:N-acetylmuramic acid 6-phosphate etherase n=1 Tax=Verrucomicrobium sp. 3C TaxID=1134055 RepID=UPI0003A05C82|nr:N-acetylmuramic acid 6-phosphate etherase [Verrucomicrobium sp. 3C]
MNTGRKERPLVEATLGIEGGGTKTTWVVLDSEGKERLQGLAGPGNISLLQEDEIRKLLAGIRSEAGGEIHSIGAAFAGCHLPVQRQRIAEILRSLWPAAVRVVVAEDTRSAFAGAFGSEEGIIVIAGTGSNVQGYRQGQWARAGGWGHILGDPGSAYDLAHIGLQRVYDVFDATGEVVPLGVSFLQRMGQNNLEELFTHILSDSSKDRIAALAPCVLEHAGAGDPLAIDVVRSRSSLLADKVGHVAKKLQFEMPKIALIGGLFEHSEAYMKLFSEEMRSRLAVREIFVSHVTGAVGAARLVTEWASDSPASEVRSRPRVSREISVALEGALTEERNPRSRFLDRKSVPELVQLFLSEERFVEQALANRKEAIATAAEAVASALERGKRLFYVGAGTSGRLGALDASEIPPTFSVSPDLVQAIMAGGSEAFFQSREGAEDDRGAGARSVVDRGVREGDVVCGITASGRTPFVLGALEQAAALGALPILLSCNPRRPAAPFVHFAIDLATGPEIVAGSTRLKAGTATKLILNMLSTIAMIRTGRVRDNLMINVQPNSEKLRYRALRLVMELVPCNEEEAFGRLERAEWRVALAIDLPTPSPGEQRRTV